MHDQAWSNKITLLGNVEDVGWPKASCKFAQSFGHYDEV